ncbi:hypothetical protein WK90_07625 [Burkholderia cepacia]|nr:hypothetical protein WI25_23595 [Burkholderia cepacia]KVA52536.1 hypothetical protein WI47_14230 [Burkholderia cepacia]KVA59791.1 hypothetical protein WI48_14350 [Burkholderia cepacia]KVA69830.1 hypothetical protein WI49_06225 [Burkholderia cepacia]KVA89942.1 hypothetical protein WI50_09850 [Burkholderia cepacia]
MHGLFSQSIMCNVADRSQVAVGRAAFRAQKQVNIVDSLVVTNELADHIVSNSLIGLGLPA